MRTTGAAPPAARCMTAHRPPRHHPRRQTRSGLRSAPPSRTCSGLSSCAGPTSTFASGARARWMPSAVWRCAGCRGCSHCSSSASGTTSGWASGSRSTTASASPPPSTWPTMCGRCRARTGVPRGLACSGPRTLWTLTPPPSYLRATGPALLRGAKRSPERIWAGRARRAPAGRRCRTSCTQCLCIRAPPPLATTLRSSRT
mmetsp:Transcript_6341/g.20842  ORF Transcript_6341/g.20842 Transcript_6341/m.20842 type:complete len:201 (-) Transcript_6341:843-1445(-)